MKEIESMLRHLLRYSESTIEFALANLDPQDELDETLYLYAIQAKQARENLVKLLSNTSTLGRYRQTTLDELIENEKQNKNDKN